MAGDTSTGPSARAPRAGQAPVIRARNDHIANVVGDWLALQRRIGARVAVLEGLPQAGKSTLLHALKCEFAIPGFVVELDDFLPRYGANDWPWDDLVLTRGGPEAISKYATEKFTLVEGAMAWRVVKWWSAATAFSGVIPRAYLKRVTQAGEAAFFWDDGDGLAAHAASHRSPMMASIYAYHSDERPWETADLVFERVDDR